MLELLSKGARCCVSSFSFVVAVYLHLPAVKLMRVMKANDGDAYGIYSHSEVLVKKVNIQFLQEFSPFVSMIRAKCTKKRTWPIPFLYHPVWLVGNERKGVKRKGSCSPRCLN
ncbi:hypothetical protein Dimus_027628 [Dionaea muscipula]